MAATFNAGAVDIDIATDTIYYTSQDNVVSVSTGPPATRITPRVAPVRARPRSGLGLRGRRRRPGHPHGVRRADGNETDLSVIDAAACNAGDRHGGVTGRGPPLRQATVPSPCGQSKQTDTIYATDTATGADTVSVIDGATCNAHITSGCGPFTSDCQGGQLPPTIWR